MSNETLEEKFANVLSTEEEKELCAFLKEQIELAEVERVGEEEIWQTIRRQRLARPQFAKKNTPWKNASNVCVPGQMIATNAIYGMTKNAFGSRRPPWTVSALNKKDETDTKIAQTITRYMMLLSESPQDLNKAARDRELQEEVDSLGTGFAKVGWTTEFSRVSIDANTSVDCVLHDGPAWKIFPREDAYYRIREPSIDRSKWFAHRLELEEHEVSQRFSSGEWTEFEKWQDFGRTESRPFEDDIDETSGGKATTRKVWDFFETFIRWDIEPKDGYYEDLLVVYNREANCLVAKSLNPYGFRPIVEMDFIKRPFRLDGVGVGHAGLLMQEELDSLHNNRINAVHLTTLKMFVARRGGSIREKEPMFPGKFFFVDNPAEDIRMLETGEVYPSSLQAENMAWAYLQKATLMTDAMTGFADNTLKSRDSIGLQTMRIKQSSGMIGAILEGMEDSYSRLGVLTFITLVYNKDRVLANETKIGRLSDEELTDLQAALEMPMDQIPLRLRFSVSTSDVEQTFEMQRQNMLTVFALYSDFQAKQLPLLMQAYATNPQTGQPVLPIQAQDTIHKFIAGNARIMERVLEFFDVNDTEHYVPSYALNEFVLSLKEMMERQQLASMAEKIGGSSGQENQGPLRGPQGGPAAPSGSNGASGMAGGAGMDQNGIGAAAPQGGQRGGGLQTLPSAGFSGSLA